MTDIKCPIYFFKDTKKLNPVSITNDNKAVE